LLFAVNDYVNSFPYLDDVSLGEWKTPSEFLSDGGGDCEDYAVYKIAILKECGFPEQDMYLLGGTCDWGTGFLKGHMIARIEFEGIDYYMSNDRETGVNEIPVEGFKTLMEFNLTKNSFTQIINIEFNDR